MLVAATAAMLAACAYKPDMTQEEAAYTDTETLCAQMRMWRGFGGAFPYPVMAELKRRHDGWVTLSGPYDLRQMPKLGAHAGEVSCLWGAPARTSRVTAGSGTAERWLYENRVWAIFDVIKIRTYLYFENGRLEAIES